MTREDFIISVIKSPSVFSFDERMEIINNSYYRNFDDDLEEIPILYTYNEYRNYKTKKQYRDEIKRINEMILSLMSTKNLFETDFLDTKIEELVKYKQNLKRYIERFDLYKKSDISFKQKIALAKEVPLCDYHQFNRINKSVCPFHNEKTPSFQYYKKTNTAHCFGSCGETFDTIAFVQKKYTLKFTEAINLILGHGK